ncbi:hypothetical protein P168DRAFT_280085 [Aspergillus campestris IBT 28561]|uniref:Uncharacterized protein n=1 Tax=Aspergillus campestris (strain IBT 28561) TaxID=1392248 RepID=A0A2I1DA02_ASPC2|nr:uncharacterized protein P168DRAFT_280085 [Aspergillus campestris IBT 28561]PKY06697.1 hypothetical protein P168DRAFT_280085 [Aspergillus campestris IBT 28561]
MSIRQKVRRVFSRSFSGSKHKDTGIKIEYYRRHEVPPSKFKGPFDREHQKSLAAWSFGDAQAGRPRSMDLSLSPCASVPDHLRHDYDDEEVAPDQMQPIAPEDRLPESDSMPIMYPRDYTSERHTHGSSSSTAVDPDSYSSSMKTLLDVNLMPDDSAAPFHKESVRHTSPVYRPISPPPMAKGTYMPFSPDDLSRALNAVQICT